MGLLEQDASFLSYYDFLLFLGHDFVFNRDLTVDIIGGKWIKLKENDKTWSFVALMDGSESNTQACFSAPGGSASSAILPDTSVGFVNLLQMIEFSESGNDYTCKLCNVTGPLEESGRHLEAVHNIKMDSQESSAAVSSIGVREDS